MSKTKLLNWFKEGQITIPATLLTHYKNLKINEHELVLLLQLISHLDKRK